jgi:AcrR family transcriptional regulator
MARDTRAEILAVASELFIEQGYDATSLREIAERLGLTKAALYYHFPSKEDILGALLEPTFAMATQLMERLEASRDVGEWAEGLDWTLEMIFDHVSFFRLVQRNRNSVELVTRSFGEMQDHLLMHERVERAAHAIAADRRQEIRMIAALGALTAFDDWAPTLLAETPPEVLRRELRSVIHAILELPDPEAEAEAVGQAPWAQ